MHFTLRDKEDAYVSLNGKTCWTKTGLYGRSGKRNECGGSANRLLYRRVFLEERFPVIGCFATLEANMPLTVRVWTNLDSHSRDESFAIDNVVIQATENGKPGRICVREQYYNVSVDLT